MQRYTGHVERAELGVSGGGEVAGAVSASSGMAVPEVDAAPVYDVGSAPERSECFQIFESRGQALEIRAENLFPVVLDGGDHPADQEAPDRGLSV